MAPSIAVLRAQAAQDRQMGIAKIENKTGTLTGGKSLHGANDTYLIHTIVVTELECVFYAYSCPHKALKADSWFGEHSKGSHRQRKNHWTTANAWRARPETRDAGLDRAAAGMETEVRR